MRPRTPWMAAAVLTLALAGCGVSSNGDEALATPTTVAITTTADPVLPGLGADADDRTPTTDRDDPDHGAARDERDERDERGDEPDPDDAALIAQMLGDYRALCGAGDERACDLLFLWADEGSDDADFGADCGGRRPGTNEYCTPALELDEEGWGDPRHPAILDLGDQCRDADGVACDLLYYVLDDAEALAEIGRSCNGRFPDGPPISCTTDG